MAAWIEEVLQAHVRPTGFVEHDNTAMGRFWGTRDALNSLLAKAEGERAFLQGWHYRIACADGDAELAFRRGRFYAKDSDSEGFMRVLWPAECNLVVL